MDAGRTVDRVKTPRKLLDSCKEIVGRRATLRREIRTRGDRVFQVGSLWRIYATWRSRFSLEGIVANGDVEIASNGCVARIVRKVDRDDFELLPVTPDDERRIAERRARGKLCQA